jgi:hypothetical protein
MTYMHLRSCRCTLLQLHATLSLFGGVGVAVSGKSMARETGGKIDGVSMHVQT